MGCKIDVMSDPTKNLNIASARGAVDLFLQPPIAVLSPKQIESNLHPIDGAPVSSFKQIPGHYQFIFRDIKKEQLAGLQFQTVVHKNNMQLDDTGKPALKNGKQLVITDPNGKISFYYDTQNPKVSLTAHPKNPDYYVVSAYYPRKQLNVNEWFRSQEYYGALRYPRDDNRIGFSFNFTESKPGLYVGIGNAEIGMVITPQPNNNKDAMKIGDPSIGLKSTGINLAIGQPSAIAGKDKNNMQSVTTNPYLPGYESLLPKNQQRPSKPLNRIPK